MCRECLLISFKIRNKNHFVITCESKIYNPISFLNFFTKGFLNETDKLEVNKIFNITREKVSIIRGRTFGVKERNKTLMKCLSPSSISTRACSNLSDLGNSKFIRTLISAR